jgi:hypothetical protein
MHSSARLAGSIDISGNERARVCAGSTRPEAVDQGTSAAKNGSLVIYLCKVGARITIAQPRSAQLTRFSFFLSHSGQGNRRKYWLQMGYFSTHVEADRWLKILRGIYPGAFVSDVSAAQAKLLSDTQATAITTGKISASAVCATSARHRPATTRKSVGARHGSADPARLPLQQQGGTFKETLEILGASELDMGSNDEVNGTGVHRNFA